MRRKKTQHEKLLNRCDKHGYFVELLDEGWYLLHEEGSGGAVDSCTITKTVAEALRTTQSWVRNRTRFRANFGGAS